MKKFLLFILINIFLICNANAITLIEALREAGDEIETIKAHHIQENTFEVYVIYKNGCIEYNLSDFELNPANQKELDDKDNTGAQRNWKVFEELRNQNPTNKNRRCIIHFLKSPQSLIGSDWIESVVLEKNKLTGESGNQQAEGTGYTEKLECGLFFRSVGYRGVEIPGVPFEEKRGVFPNNKGRIMDNNDIVPGLYTAGWIKRGPSGVIGTNKADSVETIASLIEDMPKINSCNTPSTEPIKKLLQDRNINVVSFEDWQKIDAAEIERGKKVGKPREKFTKIEEMIATVNKQ